MVRGLPSQPPFFREVYMILKRKRKNRRRTQWSWLSPSNAIVFVLQPENKIAVMGILWIQFALLPSNITGDLPHWSLPSMILLGLCCYMYKAINDQDVVYFGSNLIGMTLNTITLIRIWLA